MKKVLLFLSFITFYTLTLNSQDVILPVGWAPGEQEQAAAYRQAFELNYQAKGITTPPPFTKLRNMAEWEEIQTLCITWTSYTSILREIVKYARQETVVTIICSDSNTVKNYLTSGGVPLTNIKYLIAPFNSIWHRDYGANTVYANNVDSLLLVDWKYNRPTRPKDDTVPSALSKFYNIPMYETTASPNDIIHTGGNYMSDGFGTAFSSTLTDQENPGKTAADIDSIHKKFMGITRYIRMKTLPYDGIHHIDMHMKLLDEETILMGQYPAGVSDGPQIEANLLYVVSNFNSVYGTPYKVIRIPQPPDKNNKYPNAGGSYCTYANATFVNKTVILPTYYQQYDTTALRIWKQSLPGYKIAGIDCDNTGADIISLSGAIHCITHSIGVKDPLLISHQRLNDLCDSLNPYAVNATIMHKTGIASAKVWYTTDTTLPWSQVPMALTNVANNTWTGFIPAQSGGKTVFYYIESQATSGKSIKRPMPAPKGYWKFKINCLITGINEPGSLFIKPIFPNPASAITCIPLSSKVTQDVEVRLLNVLGQQQEVVYKGEMTAGDKNVFIDAAKYSSGVYFVEVITPAGRTTQKVVIK